jgi:hypothetical protein
MKPNKKQAKTTGVSKNCTKGQERSKIFKKNNICFAQYL